MSHHSVQMRVFSRLDPPFPSRSPKNSFHLSFSGPTDSRPVPHTPTRRSPSSVAMSAMSAAEYDALIYPGFVRRNVARWNEDGSAAPLSRARGPRGETFVLHLRSGEIDQDVSAIEAEVRQHARSCIARKSSREETRARGRA